MRSYDLRAPYTTVPRQKRRIVEIFNEMSRCQTNRVPIVRALVGRYWDYSTAQIDVVSVAMESEYRIRLASHQRVAANTGYAA